MYNFLLILHILICVLLIIVILLQSGKGGGLASAFGGSGTTEVKIFTQNIKVEGETTLWISKKVPFGVISTKGETQTNGKTETFEEKLIEFGTSGATSQITGEVEEMKMPSF